MDLLSHLLHQIAQKGDLLFVEFMQQALYHPQFGYYNGVSQKFGKEGDFITAPNLTSLYGKTLANQLQEILVLLDEPVLLEFGAGEGHLCVDILSQLEVLHCPVETYYILEVSGDLKERQYQLFKEQIPHRLHQIKWLDKWPQKPFNGIILANEVLDAMPVHRFLQTESGLLESFISFDDQNNLKEIFKPCQNEHLKQHLATRLPEDIFPYLSEANLFISGWIEQCYNLLEKGAVFLIDYGFSKHEYYHPDRASGTLMCHYQHQAHTNPLIHLGKQDITAHVDFTHVAEAAVDAGFHVAGYTNQATFLLLNGLLSFMNESMIDSVRIKTQQAIRMLTEPQEMGELFKVMTLTKNFDKTLTGFQFYDKRASL